MIKPIIMDKLHVVHTSYVVDFNFTNNITLLLGDSGSGKTVAYNIIKECMALNTAFMLKLFGL